MGPNTQSSSIKRIARLRHRLAKHKTGVATPHLVAGGSELDHDNTPAEHGLCDRCQTWKANTIRPASFERQYLATIKQSSLSPKCEFCRQFVQLFDTADELPTQFQVHSQFKLLRGKFIIDTGRGSAEVSIPYLQFNDERTQQSRKLFPTRAVHSNSSSGNKTWRAVAKVINPDLPDYDSVKLWLHTCTTEHASTCVPFSAPTAHLRLIDCKSKQVVSAHPNQRYICLSYVWGNSAVKRQAFQDLLPEVLPKTVEDAMFVAIALEIPYLWVDRYCIDQDDPQQKHVLIRSMDKIYQGAELTIIATVGDDPHHGLPGVRGTPRKSQMQLRWDNTTYVAAETVAEEISRSKWASRGCYQEMLLSRRRLVFTSTQMYFQCNHNVGVESLSAEFWKTNFVRPTPKALERSYRVFPAGGIGTVADDLCSRLEEYYERQLSFNTDIIDAFLGIINAFHTSDNIEHSLTHFYGIPIFYRQEEFVNPDHVRMSFLGGLQWNTRGVASDGPSSHMFPSWSWASVKACRSSNVQSELRTQEHSRTRDGVYYEDIDVRIWHLSHGAADLSRFPLHQDDYNHFEPWFDITSWTREYDLRANHNGEMCIDCIHDPVGTNTVEHPLALAKGKVQALCLAAGYEPQRCTSWVEGLLITEAEPGLYCRVDTFYLTIGEEYSEALAPDTQALALSVDKADHVGATHKSDEVDAASRDVQDDFIKRARKQKSRTDDAIGPRMLEHLTREPWERCTLRLI